MLKVQFLNVGDGDAILIREMEGENSLYTVLVDAGRPFLENANGSKRREIMQHLHRENVSSIDLMILTHLHIDHVGGAMNVLRHIPVKKLVVSYLPPEDRQWVNTPESDLKSVVGLTLMLNYYSDIIELAQSKGTKLCKPSSGILKLTDKLLLQYYDVNQEKRDLHDSVLNILYHNESVDEKTIYAASKLRNEVSLMQKFTYCGRSVMLCADRYGFSWEMDDVTPVDVLKLPHHGDAKSMTKTLLDKLMPQYAVISCENVFIEQKSRPDPAVVQMLKDTVESVQCTENCSIGGLEAESHTAVTYTIDSTGSISCSLE